MSRPRVGSHFFAAANQRALTPLVKVGSIAARNGETRKLDPSCGVPDGGCNLQSAGSRPPNSQYTSGALTAVANNRHPAPHFTSPGSPGYERTRGS